MGDETIRAMTLQELLEGRDKLQSELNARQQRAQPQIAAIAEDEDELGDDDENDDENGDEEEGLYLKALEDQYQLFSDKDFWNAFDYGERDFDMTDERLLYRIRRGCLNDDEAEVEQRPPVQLLRDVWELTGKATECRCSEHMQFKIWVARQAGGCKSTLNIRKAPSLDSRERQRQEGLRPVDAGYDAEARSIRR